MVLISDGTMWRVSISRPADDWLENRSVDVLDECLSVDGYAVMRWKLRVYLCHLVSWLEYHPRLRLRCRAGVNLRPRLAVPREHPPTDCRSNKTFPVLTRDVNPSLPESAGSCIFPNPTENRNENESLPRFNLEGAPFACRRVELCPLSFDVRELFKESAWLFPEFRVESIRKTLGDAACNIIPVTFAGKLDPFAS